MNPSTLIGIFASMLLLVSVLFFTAESPESFINVPGLAIVITGTLAATFISYPLKEVLRVVRLVGLVFRRENTYVRDDINELVSMSRLWFKGDVRAVERELEHTRNPFLRTGIQLVIANTKEDEIFDMLRWRIARLKAREHAEAQIFSHHGDLRARFRHDRHVSGAGQHARSHGCRRPSGHRPPHGGSTADHLLRYLAGQPRVQAHCRQAGAAHRGAVDYHEHGARRDFIDHQAPLAIVH